MAVFNYGSNMSSTTTIVNGTAYTQNIINLGGNSTCTSGPEYCQDGYSIYVPCLKNITRGQKVCFELYLADKSKQDTLDLNDLCGLTLSLTGPFGCPYDDYTWPDDIESLQGEELSELKCESFDGNIYRLDLGFIELNDNRLNEVDMSEVNKSPDGLNVCVKGVYGDFCVGQTPYLTANDSPTHIFVGWTTSERISELCDNFKVDDVIITNEHEWKWEEPIHEDISIYAIYRKRKTYEVRVSFDNRHSYFMVDYDGKVTMLSDKARDKVTVLEGYEFNVTCEPIITKDRNNNVEKTYIFKRWSDGYSLQSRKYLATDSLFTNGELRLYAICDDERIDEDKSYNISNTLESPKNIFCTCLPDENVFDEKMMVEYVPSENVIDFSGVYQVYDPFNEKNHTYISLDKDGFISFDSGEESGVSVKIVLKIDTNNINFETIGTQLWFPNTMGEGKSDMLKPQPLYPYKEPKPVGSVSVKNSEHVETIDIYTKDDTELEFEFNDCEDGVFEITTTLESLLIDSLCVYEKIITDKGKIRLCIPPEDTLKFYRGVLNMSGAICVDGEWSGLDSVQVGVVNKLNPIQVKIEE